jgi:GT2 family glycosyltransferase
MSQVAVVVLNYNGKHFLKRFLPPLIEHSPGAEIIVADNASTDTSAQFLETLPKVRTIRLNKNFGFAEGYNQALDQVQADYFVLVNSDVLVTPGWLLPLLDFLDNHPKYAAVQPKILSEGNPTRFDYAGAAGGFLDAFGYPYCRGRVFGEIEEDHGQYDQTQDVHWTSGACMVVRKEVFQHFGGFDRDFFAHMEEVDLCWHMRSGGYSLACIPSSVVYHVGGGTLSHTSPFKTYLNFRNGLALLVKNLPVGQLWWKLPVRLMLDGIAALKFSIQVSPRHLLSILKAHFHFYRDLGKTWKKRQETSSPGKGLVVFSHYVLRKKRYSEMNQ